MNILGTVIVSAACTFALPIQAQQKKTNQAGNTQTANLQKQVKALTEERDALKQDNAELLRQLDEASSQSEQVTEELEQIKATLRENQTGGESLLKELQMAKASLSSSKSRAEALEKKVAALESRLDDAENIKDGALVHYGPNIIPAKCLNLRRMTPNTKRVSGIVVVNCLINEQGEPVDVRIVQPLAGDATEWTERAHEACLEAAKKLAFEPATTLDGVRVKVWQGIGFYLN